MLNLVSFHLIIIQNGQIHLLRKWIALASKWSKKYSEIFSFLAAPCSLLIVLSCDCFVVFLCLFLSLSHSQFNRVHISLELCHYSHLILIPTDIPLFWWLRFYKCVRLSLQTPVHIISTPFVVVISICISLMTAFWSQLTESQWSSNDQRAKLWNCHISNGMEKGISFIYHEQNRF